MTTYPVYKFQYNVPFDYQHLKWTTFIGFIITNVDGQLLIKIDDALLIDLQNIKDWDSIRKDVTELANLYFKNKMNETAY